MPESRLPILSLSLREHLRKLFHVFPFRDVPSAVSAHDYLLGILGPTKAKPIGDHPSFSCQGRGVKGMTPALPWWPHFYWRFHHGFPSTAKLGLPPGHAPITSPGQWHR